MANGAPITPTAQPTDVMSQIDSLKNSQIAASTASLGAARDSSLSNIGVEQAKIAPQYYTSRNTAATQSDLGAKNFAEFLAQRGQSNSGLAGQSQISNNAALQGQIGVLNTAEANANTDITHRQTDTNNTYNSSLAQATAQANAAASQSIIAETQRQQAAAALKAQQDAQMAMQKQQFAADQAFKQKQLASSNANAAASLRASQARASAPKAPKAPTAAQRTSTATGQAQNYLNAWAEGKATDDNGKNIGRATRDGILNWVNQNAGDLTSQGVNANNLHSWADKTFLWNPAPVAPTPAPVHQWWNPWS